MTLTLFGWVEFEQASPCGFDPNPENSHLKWTI